MFCSISGSPGMVLWEGSPHGVPDCEVHERLCALAVSMAAGSRVIFRYLAGDLAADLGEAFVLCIEPADLPSYLGVRGFALLTDTADSGPYRIAVAQRRVMRMREAAH